jgi:LCP family protein required for cell wall assembly
MPGKKINDAYYQNGMAGAVEAVEALTGVSIKYHFDMGFVQFEKFVDALGGVTAHVPMNMSLKGIVSDDDISLSAGTHLLDGQETLVLARMRKDYPGDEDASRQIQDRQILAVIMLQIAKNAGLVDHGVEALYAHADTNWERDAFIETLADFVDNADKIAIISGSGPYKGGIHAEYGDLWLAYRDEILWKEIIQLVEQGGDPTTLVELPNL